MAGCGNDSALLLKQQSSTQAPDLTQLRSGALLPSRAGMVKVDTYLTRQTLMSEQKYTLQREMVLSILIGQANMGASEQELQQALEQIKSITLAEIIEGAKASKAGSGALDGETMTLAESIRRKIAEAQAAQNK